MTPCSLTTASVALLLFVQRLRAAVSLGVPRRGTMPVAVAAVAAAVHLQHGDGLRPCLTASTAPSDPAARLVVCLAVCLYLPGAVPKQTSHEDNTRRTNEAHSKCAARRCARILCRVRAPALLLVLRPSMETAQHSLRQRHAARCGVVLPKRVRWT